LENSEAHVAELQRRLRECERELLGFEEYAKQVKDQKARLKQTFKLELIEANVMAFRDTIDVPHVPSAKERETGCDVSPHIAGKLPYFSIHKNPASNMALLRTECQARYDEYPAPTSSDKRPSNIDRLGVSLLKNWIKQDEIRRFGDDNEKEKKEAERFFVPRFTEFIEYTWTQIKKN
jgi:hypothetical protein